MKTTSLTLLLILYGTTVMASKEQTNITIYSTHQTGTINPNQLQNPHSIPGFAMIRQHKELAFTKGSGQLVFDEVTEYIDPTTVSLLLPEKIQNQVKVLDQNYQFDLVDNNKLLQKYIGQAISINHNLGETSVNTTGKLLSANGGLIIQQANNSIKTINQWNHITFNELPEGLLIKPTLVWQVDSQTKGNHPVTVSYQSQGMTWWADYNITLNESTDACHMDLSAWVSIVNKSGAHFNNSQLKLIAGDINRVTQAQPEVRMMAKAAVQDTAAMSSEPLFEYHMYRLPYLVNLPNHSAKQLPLLSNLQNIPCKKILTFNATKLSHVNFHQPITHSNYYAKSKGHAEASLQFDNNKAHQLGIPMPAGRVRVNVHNKQDNSMEFVGEDLIGHTPKNERIELTLGQAFDVTGSRTQTDFISEKNGVTETFEIHLSNQKEHEITVHVVEPMYRWSNWRIIDSTHPYSKTQAHLIQFEVTLKPESKKTMKYSVKYEWPEK